jgi:hypothetical protein
MGLIYDKSFVFVVLCIYLSGEWGKCFFFFLFFLMWWNATPLTIENEIIEAWKESLLICLFYSDLMLVKWVKLSLVCWDLVGGKNEFGSAIDY